MSSGTSTVASNLATTSTPLTFSGVSKYSSDLQTILQRSQQIAQMPVKLLQNDQTDLADEVKALTSMQGTVSALTTSLKNLGQVVANGALTASSSNTAASASVTGSNAAPGTYTISDVTSLASVSTATMTTGVANASTTKIAPTDTNKIYLDAGSGPVEIQLTADTNNLNGLATAINKAALGVSATVITTSGASYLTLTADTAGAKTLRLQTDKNDTGTDLMTMDHTGSLAQFSVNGKATTSTTNKVSDVIPGLTLSLNSTMSTGTSATITVAANASPLATSLQSLTTAYNTLVTAVQSQTGTNGGTLTGSNAIRAIQQQMRQLAFYQGSGDVTSLMDLGITLNKDGSMSFDSTVVSAMTSQELGSALSFIGNGSTGLSAIATQFSQISDSTTGTLQDQIASDQKAEQRIQSQIDDMNVRIASSLKAQMAKLQAADALLAKLTNQQNTLTASLQSLNYTLYGKSTSSSSSS